MGSLKGSVWVYLFNAPPHFAHVMWGVEGKAGGVITGTFVEELWGVAPSSDKKQASSFPCTSIWLLENVLVGPTWRTGWQPHHLTLTEWGAPGPRFRLTVYTWPFIQSTRSLGREDMNPLERGAHWGFWKVKWLAQGHQLLSYVSTAPLQRPSGACFTTFHAIYLQAV